MSAVSEDEAAVASDLIVSGILVDIAMTMTRALASGEPLAGELLAALRDQIVIAAEKTRQQEEELKQGRPLIDQMLLAAMAGGRMQ